MCRVAALVAVMAAGGMPVSAWSAGAADHSGHTAGSDLRRSEAMLQPAAAPVQRQDGSRSDLRRVLDDGRPVMLNFIFTSCTAICPVTSQVFSEVRERLGKQRDDIHVVSISIDPEYDTPQRLADYAKRFSSGGAWTFLTSTQVDAASIQKSFAAYQGDKMNHVPVTFLRAAPGKAWVRLDGFASPSLLVTEIKALLPAKAAQAGPPSLLASTSRRTPNSQP
jgi:protein SCO1/2